MMRHGSSIRSNSTIREGALRKLLVVLATVTTALAGGAGPVRAQARTVKIALIAKSEANFVFLAARRGAEEKAAALSRQHGVRIEVAWLTPAKEDAAQQAERIRQAVQGTRPGHSPRGLRRAPRSPRPWTRPSSRRRGDDLRQRRAELEALRLLRRRRHGPRREGGRRPGDAPGWQGSGRDPRRQAPTRTTSRRARTAVRTRAGAPAGDRGGRRSSTTWRRRSRPSRRC